MNINYLYLIIGIWPHCNIYATTSRNTYLPPTTTTPITTSSTTPSTTTPKSTTTTTTTTSTTTPKSTTTTTTTTTIRTTTKPKPCHCECSSDQYIIFSDGVRRDPARLYKRASNINHPEN